MKKKNKILIIIIVLFLITAAAFMIVGFALSGANILAWFGSKWAWLFYFAFGLYGIFVAGLFIGDWIKRI